jgi:hypothetical protein
MSLISSTCSILSQLTLKRIFGACAWIKSKYAKPLEGIQAANLTYNEEFGMLRTRLHILSHS